MDWLDHLSLPIVMIAPIVGATFLLFIPEYDALLRKKVAVFVIAIAGVFHARTSILLFHKNQVFIDLTTFRPSIFNGNFLFRLDFLAFIALSYLILIVFLLLYFSQNMNDEVRPQFNSIALVVLGLTSAAILLENLGYCLLIQFSVIQTLLVVNLIHGGSHRSSSALAASLFFTIIDLSAFFAWSWNEDLSLWIDPAFLSFAVAFPFITRLLAPFLAPWSRLFFANSAIEVMILYLGSSFILGAVGLARTPLDNPLVSHFMLFAAFFGALLSLSDHTPSQFLLRFASIGGALVSALLCNARDMDFSIRALLFASCLASIICLALLVEHARPLLNSLWFATLILLVGIPFFGIGSFIWQIFPATSISGLVILLVTSFSLSFRVKRAIAGVTNSNSSVFSPSMLVNAWSCFALVLGTAIAFQILFPMVVHSQ